MIKDAVETQATPSSVAKIELAIGAAKQRFADAAASIEQLQAKRRRALVADGKAVDQIETDLTKAKKIFLRERDLLQVLEEDLAEAKTLEQQRSFDTLFKRASTARQIGEALIRNEYAQWAAKGADILAKLTAIDAFIRNSNTIFAGGTATAPVDSLNRRVAGPNDIRRVPDQLIPATTREVEYQEKAGHFNGVSTPYVTKTRIEDVPEQRIPGNWVPELYDDCVIVPVMKGSPEWDKHGRSKAEAEKRYEEIIATLVGEI